ncbi:MAG: sulfur carrier protein ThiS [Candidatus Eremiobacteraeota bacterium]|nr:sulfur carrier protein ThiS [Candidatus Eremiobacteraeota bacterium]MBC5827637.1 sulfur carrier protein ThiS [Candidatus Eremiobacteraeota bacterium]
MISIMANGRSRSARRGESVADLLMELRLAPAQVLVEYNGEPLARRLYSTTLLRQGDALEIAHMVGGG